MSVKYFVDYDGIVRDTTEPVYSCSPQFVDETIILVDSDGLVCCEFQSHNSLYDLEKAGVNTLTYRIKNFIKELTDLNEKSATIGDGNMTYYEIINWIQNYLIEINEVQIGKYEITHLDDDGCVFTMKANSLIEAVLKINELDLIN